MTELEELYNSIEVLRKHGLNVSDDLVRQIEQKETEFMQKEIIPAIKDCVSFMFDGLKHDAMLVVDYKVGKPVDVRIVKKKPAIEEVAPVSKKSTSPPAMITEPSTGKRIFMITTQKGAKGKGYLCSDNKSFVLLAGSVICNETTNTFNCYDLYNDIKRNYCDNVNGKYILRSDYRFGSPSTAACVLQGRSANGWRDWKDAGGRTLDEVYRK